MDEEQLQGYFLRNGVVEGFLEDNRGWVVSYIPTAPAGFFPGGEREVGVKLDSSLSFGEIRKIIRAYKPKFQRDAVSDRVVSVVEKMVREKLHFSSFFVYPAH